MTKEKKVNQSVDVVKQESTIVEGKHEKQKAKKRILIMHLGETYPIGSEVPEEVVQELIQAGFTEERLFGK